MIRQILIPMGALLLLACSSSEHVNQSRASAPEEGVASEALKVPVEDSDEYLRWPTTAAAQLAADKEKEDFIASRYSASAVAHSFAYGGGYIDCVDELQQPGNVPGQALATPPPPLADAGPPASLPAGAHVGQTMLQAVANNVDADGNLMHCPVGTVPIPRVTTATLAPFPTLKAYLKQGVNERREAATHRREAATHRHAMSPMTDPGWDAVGGFWAMENSTLTQMVGLSSLISLWNPYLDYAGEPYYNHVGTQFWLYYWAGEYGDPTTETAEYGLALDPSNSMYTHGWYNNANARLFTFCSHGYYFFQCVNNSCDEGASWTSYGSSGIVGGDEFSEYSTITGPIDQSTLFYEVYQGNIWFSYDGTWFGYYSNGCAPNVANGNAFEGQWGGEVHWGSPLPAITYTQMGSGINPEIFTGDANDFYSGAMDDILMTINDDGYVNIVPNIDTSSIVTDFNCYGTYSENFTNGSGTVTHSLFYGGYGGSYPTCP